MRSVSSTASNPISILGTIYRVSIEDKFPAEGCSELGNPISQKIEAKNICPK
jgi:hypothetical protein